MRALPDRGPDRPAQPAETSVGLRGVGQEHPLDRGPDQQDPIQGQLRQIHSQCPGIPVRQMKDLSEGRNARQKTPI